MISPEHVIAALKKLGFAEYVPEVTQAYEETKKRSFKTQKTKAGRLWTDSRTAIGTTESAFRKCKVSLVTKTTATSEPVNTACIYF